MSPSTGESGSGLASRGGSQTTVGEPPNSLGRDVIQLSKETLSMAQRERKGMRVTCTSCHFEEVVDPDSDILAAELVVQHGEATGHKLNISPVLETTESQPTGQDAPVAPTASR